MLLEEHASIAPESMMQLNSIGAQFGAMDYVEAITDVTGFGLLGHLTEMCEGSGVSAEIRFDDVPTIDKQILDHYLEQGSAPGGTNRNFASYGQGIIGLDEYRKRILCDPQTSGGLLVAVSPDGKEAFELQTAKAGLHVQSFGSLISQQDFCISVI